MGRHRETEPPADTMDFPAIKDAADTDTFAFAPQIPAGQDWHAQAQLMRSAEFVVDHAKMGISRDDDVSRRAARILRATREDPYPVQVHGIEPAVLHPTAIEAPSRKQRAERRRSQLKGQPPGD